MHSSARHRVLSLGFAQVFLFGAPVATALADGQMRITEYMYTGSGGEFMEFTNVGDAPVNMTGWSYDDEGQVPGEFSLSAFGTVAAGESVILAEAPAAVFRADWGLGAAVKIIGELGNPAGGNLNRNDMINLYDARLSLVDQLDFGDQQFPGSIRTDGISGWVCAQALGDNDPFGWVLAQPGDVQGSFASANGDLGNPSSFLTLSCGPPPTGACCAAGDCDPDLNTQALCTGFGLFFVGQDCDTFTCPAPTGAVVRITEYMHGGPGGEFIEFTNLDSAPVNMAGWSFSDVTNLAGNVDLDAFGILMPGESAILAEVPAEDFEEDWLRSGVAVIGSNMVNIGAADQINLYDPSGAVVDRLTYGALVFTGSVDADARSAWVCSAGLGADDPYAWRLSNPDDVQGSFGSLVGAVGNPGGFTDFECGTGSCCVSGVCSNLTLTECSAASGLFLGEGTSCGADPCPPPSGATVRITEYMYTGIGGEFFEVTNLGAAAVNFSGWSFADEANVPGNFVIGGLGILQPGESGVVTQDPVAAFITDWGLAGVAVISLASGGELARNDVLHIYDASGTLIDRLAYGDEVFDASVRANGAGAWPCSIAVGADNIYGWVLAEPGDPQDSVLSANGDVGSPGAYAQFACPVGACCAAGNCTASIAGYCIGVGLYQGDGTACGAPSCPAPSGAEVRITEYLYDGLSGEFVEFTNLEAVPVNLAGWSFDDDSRIPGRVDLTGLGVVAPGESVILSERLAGNFSADWQLAGVTVLGGQTLANLSSDDELNLYDYSGALVDRLTYGSVSFPGTVDATGSSAWGCAGALGTNDIDRWVASAPGDDQDSVLSLQGDVGSPGAFADIACPVECATTADCADEDADGIRDDACAWVACEAGQCVFLNRDAGQADMAGFAGACVIDGACDINDKFAAQNCFANQNTLGQAGYPCEDEPPNALNIDAVGFAGSCVLDGVCDINDAFSSQNCFGNQDTQGNAPFPCICTGAPAPQTAPPARPQPVAWSGILLRGPRTARPGDVIVIDVYLEAALKQLSGYQLHLAERGGQRGALVLEDISVNPARPDDVAGGSGGEDWSAFNVQTHQMLRGFGPEGIQPGAGSHLATFTYRVSAQARGTFVVGLEHDEFSAVPVGRSFLFASPHQPVGISEAQEVLIRVRE